MMMDDKQMHFQAELTPFPYERGIGLLLPLFSLPSPYGIGTLGKAAFDFIDYLHRAGIGYWQILPIGPTIFGNSPYSSLSSYGGNPLFLDLDELTNKGLLKEEEKDHCTVEDPSRVDYSALYKNRPPLFQKAFDRFKKKKEEDLTLAMDYEGFLQENDDWLRDYALFCVIRKKQGQKPWTIWPKELKNREDEAILAFEKAHENDLQYEKFLQFIFFQQWEKLKSYAHQKGISLIGDFPIYLALDSADVWKNPDLFQLDEKGNPLFVSGAPPDYYNEDGQKWDNPLYHWPAIQAEGYSFWTSRLRFSLKRFDLLRLDHFLGYEHYWKIPAGDPTARGGFWEKGPGLQLFQALESALGPLPFFAEDLGAVDEKVIALREKTGFAGMCPIEFAFSSKDSPYLPHHYLRRSVACTSTHDSEPLKSWWDHQDPWRREEIRAYFHLTEEEDVPWAIMRALSLSRADLCLFSMQDILGLGNEGRINIPGTVGENWTWRMLPDYQCFGREEELKKLSKESGRFHE